MAEKTTKTKKRKSKVPTPLEFVENVIKARPTEQQKQALRAFPSASAMAIRSGHGPGKTALLAWLIIWYLLHHPQSIVPCTAPTGNQLSGILWPEIKRWIEFAGLGQFFNWQKTKLGIIGSEDTWFAVLRSAARGENLAGYHAKYLMYVIDEASGMAKDKTEVIEGALTQKNAKIIMVGNPTQVSGVFFDAFHKDRKHYTTLHFSSAESSLVSAEWIMRMREKYGEQSDIYKVRVLGEFPTRNERGFIPISLCEAAVMREKDMDGMARIGVDPARYGECESAICTVVGNTVQPIEAFRGIDTGELAGRVLIAARRARELTGQGIVAINVDETGIGAGVVDQLFLAQRNGAGILVNPIAFGGAGDKDAANKAARMWIRMKERLEEISLPDDEELIAELSVREYEIRPDGKIKLEEKDHMKARGVPSPDRADALALALWVEAPRGVAHVGKTDRSNDTAHPVTAGYRERKW